MKTCSKCKIEKPFTEFNKDALKKDGLESSCKACKAAHYAANSEKIKDKSAKRRAASREAFKAKDAAYYAANRETFAAKSAAYRAANREALKAYKAEYRASNSEALKTKALEYYAANPEKCKAQHAKYRAANPEKCAAKDRNRRALKRDAEGKHTAADIRAIFTAQKGLCANCETKLLKSGAKKYHVDHIMPLALGGSNWPNNLQCLCPTCNLSKSAKHPGEWARQQGRLL